MYTGLTGSLKIFNGTIFEPVTVAYISGWSIEDKTEVIETTRLDQTHKETFPSFQSWSASADGAVAFECVDSQTALFAAKYAGGLVKLEFHLMDDSEGEGKSTCFCGEGYIESLGVDLSAEDKGNISISVRGSGPLKLYVNGVEIPATNPPNVYNQSLRFKIDDGDLYVTVPDGLENVVYLDQNTGELIITI